MAEEAPKAELRCKIRYRGHQHATGCWAMPDQITHHKMVYAEGRDFQCVCGVWGSAEPGYMGYQWHLESLIEDMAKATPAMTEQLAAIGAARQFLIAHDRVIVSAVPTRDDSFVMKRAADRFREVLREYDRAIGRAT